MLEASMDGQDRQDNVKILFILSIHALCRSFSEYTQELENPLQNCSKQHSASEVFTCLVAQSR